MDRVKNFISQYPSFLPISLVILIFIALMFFMGIQITSKQVRLFGRAADAGLVDPSTSSIWATQYSVKVGSSTNVSVFLHNSENRAVSGKSVKLNLSPVEITEIASEATTDADGKATFAITAKAPGRLTVTVVGDGVTLSKNLTLEFVK